MHANSRSRCWTLLSGKRFMLHINDPSTDRPFEVTTALSVAGDLHEIKQHRSPIAHLHLIPCGLPRNRNIRTVNINKEKLLAWGYDITHFVLITSAVNINNWNRYSRYSTEIVASSNSTFTLGRPTANTLTRTYAYVWPSLLNWYNSTKTSFTICLTVYVIIYLVIILLP